MTEEANPPPDYNALPDAIKHQVSPKEWAWLPDASKARLIQTETEPDPE
jgi:hypothetical protein